MLRWRFWDKLFIQNLSFQAFHLLHFLKACPFSGLTSIPALPLASQFSQSKILHSQQLKSCVGKKESIPALPVVKLALHPQQGVELLSQSWRCGSLPATWSLPAICSLPATWWSGAETLEKCSQKSLVVGSMGTPCISDLKICRDEMQTNT